MLSKRLCYLLGKNTILNNRVRTSKIFHHSCSKFTDDTYTTKQINVNFDKMPAYTNNRHDYSYTGKLKTINHSISIPINHCDNKCSGDLITYVDNDKNIYCAKVTITCSHITDEFYENNLKNLKHLSYHGDNKLVYWHNSKDFYSEYGRKIFENKFRTVHKSIHSLFRK